MSRPNCGSVVPVGDAVEPQPGGLPLGGGREAGEEAEEDRDAPHREAAQRLDDLLVAVELRAQPRVHRPQPVGELDREPHRHRHAEESDRRTSRRRAIHWVASTRLEAELVVPEPVGVQVREDEERHHERGDDRDVIARRSGAGGRGRSRRRSWSPSHPRRASGRRPCSAGDSLRFCAAAKPLSSRVAGRQRSRSPSPSPIASSDRQRVVEGLHREHGSPPGM